jgi:hypothetical protein
MCQGRPRAERRDQPAACSVARQNVVSAAKILELPNDAADAVGAFRCRPDRVGAGDQVIIRGMAPLVTIEGSSFSGHSVEQRHPASCGVSTSHVSATGRRPEHDFVQLLGGIEVVKAITPDMDATLIGGTINFTLRRAARNTPMAPRNQSWVPSVEIRTEGGYNGLKNTRNDYRVVASLENRFFDESFGFFLQGSLERRNLSDNTMSASLMLLNKAPTIMESRRSARSWSTTIPDTNGKGRRSF